MGQVEAILNILPEGEKNPFEIEQPVGPEENNNPWGISLLNGHILLAVNAFFYHLEAPVVMIHCGLTKEYVIGMPSTPMSQS